MKIVRPKTDILKESSIFVEHVLVDLKKIGVTFFSHTRIFDDGSRIDLNNCPEMAEEFYFGKARLYKDYKPEVSPKSLQTNILCLDSFQDNNSVEFLREGFGIDHMVVQIDKHDNYCDVWNFGAKPENYHFYSSFFSNKETINLFIKYYLMKGEELIENFSNDRIIVVEKDVTHADKFTYLALDDASLEVKESILSKFDRFILNDGTYLTKSEIEYCKLLVKGHSRSDIAKAHVKSPRTVDTHIQNIKLKLGCDTKSKMISILTSIGF